MARRSDSVYHSSDPFALVEPVPPSISGWPMYSRGWTKEAVNPDSTVPENPGRRWTYGIDDSAEHGPVLGDNAVLFGSENNTIYAIEQSDGSQRWSYSTSNWPYGIGAYANGVFFIGDDDGNFYALNTSDGSLKWSINTGGWVRGAPVVKDEVVYMNTDATPEVRALNTSDGSEVWTRDLSTQFFTSMALADGVLYSGAEPGFIALNAGDGSTKWTRSISWQDNRAAPAVVNGSVYIGEDGPNVRNLYSLNANDGSTEWKFQSERDEFTYNNNFVSSPAVYNGTVFAGCRDEYLYAINASDGTKKWHFDTHGEILSSPAIADGKVVVGTRNYDLHALDPSDGSEIWAKEVNSSVNGSPAIQNGDVYCCTNSYGQSVVAYKQDWYHDGHDYRNTGFNPHTSASDGSISWETTDPVQPIRRVIMADDTLFVGAEGSIYAYNSGDGSRKWRYQPSNSYHLALSYGDGTVFTGNSNNKVHSVNATDGTQNWERSFSYSVQGLTYEHQFMPYLFGTYGQSPGGGVFCINTDGNSLEWENSYSSGASKSNTPTVVNDVVYAGLEQNGIYALDKWDGSEIWSNSGRVPHGPVVKNEIAYYGDNDDYSVHAVNVSDGSSVWTADLSEFYDQPFSLANGTLYVNGEYGTLYALDVSDGSQKWSYSANNALDVSQPAVGGGRVYIGDDGGWVYAINEDGSEAWTYDANTNRTAFNPAIVSGTLYMGTSEPRLIAFE